MRSPAGRLAQASRPVCAALGLRRMHQTVEVEDSPCTRGMIRKVSYMLKVEEA